MLLKYLNTNRPGVLFLLPFFTAILWLPFILHPTEPVSTVNSPYVFLFKYDLLMGGNSGIVMAASITILTAILINNIIINSDLGDKTSYVYAFAYLVFETLIRSNGYLFVWQLSLIALLAITWLLLKIFNQQQVADISFQAGLFSGLAFFIYPPSVIYMVMVFLFIQRFRSFYWREWFFPFLGFGVVLLFYYTGKLVSDSPMFHVFVIKPYDFYQFYHSNFWVHNTLIVLLLISILFYTKGLKRAIMHARKQRQLMMLNLFILIAFCVTMNLSRFAHIEPVLCLIPYTVIAGYYLSHCKRAWFAELLFLTLCMLQLVKYQF